MATRRLLLSAVLALLVIPGIGSAAAVHSTNFVVEAPTPELAQEFARLAEHYRKQKAIEWIGREMPNWAQPCQLRVTVSSQGAGGATTFDFSRRDIYQQMHIEGSLERLKNSVLPHEVTHTVFAYHFRQPVPRWADEGGSVYSEDEVERRRHDQMCRQILNAGRGIPLRRLFNLKDYPSDVMVLYAQGYSVSRYLIEASDRQTFLDFVAHGMSQRGWDDAVRTFYQYKSVDELEQAWLDSLRKGRGTMVARGDAPQAATAGLGGDNKLVIRQSSWPSRPELEPLPVARGQSPAGGQGNERFGASSTSGWNRPSASLGQPEAIPAPGARVDNESSTIVASLPKHRPAPPPVVLFPPEPLPR
jgi:hypothetical protein